MSSKHLGSTYVTKQEQRCSHFPQGVSWLPEMQFNASMNCRGAACALRWGAGGDAPLQEAGAISRRRRGTERGTGAHRDPPREHLPELRWSSRSSPSFSSPEPVPGASWQRHMFLPTHPPGLCWLSPDAVPMFNQNGTFSSGWRGGMAALSTSTEGTAQSPGLSVSGGSVPRGWRCALWGIRG